ncbi:hypothetical protein FPV67DRAFT_1467303, partial [Lyophyllum atratum]
MNDLPQISLSLIPRRLLSTMLSDPDGYSHEPWTLQSSDGSADEFETMQETSLRLPNIPPEIWLRIFAYLSDLPTDLKASTLTCSSFRTLAQPLLFTVIDVSPFFLAYSVDRRIYRPRKYLDRTAQRLDFYCSPRIAPAVTHCWISPYSRTGFPARNPRDNLDAELIIDKVVEALPSFPNLRNLSWHCTDFTAKWWDVIYRLPVKNLWLNSCMIEGVDPQPLFIQHLDLDQWAWEGEVTNHVSIHEEHSPGVSEAILPVILHPDHIQHISMPRTDTCTGLFSVMASMDTFTSLRVLRVPFDAIASPCFIPALLQCPILEELRIFSPMDEEHRELTMAYLPPDALPSLSIYEGPYTYLLAFGIGRSLKKALIWGLDDPPALCDPSRLVYELRRLSLFNPTLDTLHMSVSCISVELLTAISSFRRLKSVEISSADSPSPLEDPASDGPHQRSSSSPVNLLYIALRTIQFPPKLENLRITTKLNHGNLDGPTQRHEASKLIESMARTHSMLQNVEIGYGTYWTGTYIARWRRLASLADGGTDLLGKLTFNEHRRTIVFPDAQRRRVRCRLGRGKGGEQGTFFCYMATPLDLQVSL